MEGCPLEGTGKVRGNGLLSFGFNGPHLLDTRGVIFSASYWHRDDGDLTENYIVRP